MSPYKDPIIRKQKNIEYQKKYYKNNRQYYIDKSKKRREKIKELYIEYKKTLKCEVCGENRWYCLDFHHITDDKIIEISRTIRRAWGWTRIMKEISKCKVLCRNCHAEVHFKPS